MNMVIKIYCYPGGIREGLRRTSNSSVAVTFDYNAFINAI